MSVQRNDIVIIGHMVSFPEYKETYLDEAERAQWVDDVESYRFDKYNVKPAPWDGKLTGIFDGMNGKYVIVGYLVNSSQAEEWNGMTMHELTFSQIDSLFKSVNTSLFVCKIFEKFKRPLDVKLYSFSHFS